MRPSWDEYFVNLALEVAKRSTCLHRQCGAVIVRGKQIVSTGYNGSASGQPHCLDIGCARNDVPSGQRVELCRAAHAEQNAINFAARYGIGVEGATMYSTHYPCSWCAKSIINAGIGRVVYLKEYPDDSAIGILCDIEVVHFKL